MRNFNAIKFGENKKQALTLRHNDTPTNYNEYR